MNDFQNLSIPANGSVSGLSLEEKRMIELCWFKCTQKQLKRCTEDIFAAILKQDETLLKLFKLVSNKGTFNARNSAARCPL